MVALPDDDVDTGLGALRVVPREVAANRRRAIVLCAYAAFVPAVVLGVLCAAAVTVLVGAVVFVVCAVVVGGLTWRLSPSVALRRIGAVVVVEQDHPRLFNVAEGLCATFGLPLPAFRLLDDDVPNACALGRDTRSAEIVVTSGLLRSADPIELEGVLAHELAHVKRGDNGVACVGITLATLVGGEAMLRRCLGEGREYRADVVGVSSVNYPRGLLAALQAMMASPPPAEGSFFATPSRFGPTCWVWIDPSVGHRDDRPAPGDLDVTSVRARGTERVVRLQLGTRR